MNASIIPTAILARAMRFTGTGACRRSSISWRLLKSMVKGMAVPWIPVMRILMPTMPQNIWGWKWSGIMPMAGRI